MFFFCFLFFRVKVRKLDGKEGWLPMSVVKQSEDNPALTGSNDPEDLRCRRE